MIVYVQALPDAVIMTFCCPPPNNEGETKLRMGAFDTVVGVKVICKVEALVSLAL